MYYITDYRKRAINKIIPYLINFPQVVSIIEQSADRYQAIEDVIWQIANNFKLDDARGVFLQALAHNEATKIVYTDKAQDAFTYGTDKPLFQAYGTGHYYSQASYISGIKKDITDEKTIRAVKAKIIQNNTDCTIEDLIEGLKLVYNADKIRVYESNPLAISLELIGSQLEVSSSGNKEIIKEFLPATVALKNIYLNKGDFDVFRYDDHSYYGVSRYPILVKDTTNVYHYISNSITLTSQYKEYINVPNGTYAKNSYICIVGEFPKVTKNGVFINCTDGTNACRLYINSDGKFEVQQVNNNSSVVYPTDITAQTHKRYTISFCNDNNKLKLWVYDSLKVNGNYIDRDTSFITNTIQSTTPLLEINNSPAIDKPIIINKSSLNETQYNDFTYYAFIFGNNDSSTPKEYYISEFGEKQVLFNCYENKNHLEVVTSNPLDKNITTKQYYFNYKINHFGSRYLYFDGKSGINYNIGGSNKAVKEFDISFDLCMPAVLKSGDIICDFVGDENSSKISIDETGKLSLNIPVTVTVDDVEQTDVITYTTTDPVIQISEYARFHIHVTSDNIKFYKNDIEIYNVNISGIINNIPPILRIAYDKNITDPYKGILKDVFINIIDTDDKTLSVNLPYTLTLQDSDKSFTYTNYGARFITVPQLFNNTDNTDLFNNEVYTRR